MFRKLLCLAIFFPCIAYSQNNDADTSLKPLVTPVGETFGEIASAKIGKGGGTLKSADGGLEVIIPENALDSKKTISIQSSHNVLDDNDRGSYRLEPSGIQFKEPVKLMFHYTDSTEIVEIQSIAWQDDKGQWHKPNNIIKDTIQKNIIVLTNHFSIWEKFSQLYLDPPAGRVKVSKTLSISIVLRDRLTGPLHDWAISNAQKTDEGDDLAFPPRVYPFYTTDWSVNGNKNGTPVDGTLRPIIGTKNSWNDIYKAPQTVPEINPVAVSVRIYAKDGKRKQLLTSHITVLGDQYHLTFIHIDENGCYFLVDSSSCILNLDMEKRTVVVTKIKNYTPYSDWPSSCAGCKNNWTNKESLKGLVEITGISYSHIIPPAKPGGLINVNINFTPTMGNTPSAIVSCPGAPTTYTTPSKPYPASPQTINFDIDGDDIIIHAAGKTGINELVIPGKEEKAIIYIYKVHQF